MAQEWAKPFYNSTAWKSIRVEILKRDRYLCQMDGCRRTAEEVHHIKELTEENVNDVSIALNPDNLISLCADCHKRITKQMHAKGSGILEDIIFDADGYPVAACDSPRWGGSKFSAAKTDRVP